MGCCKSAANDVEAPGATKGSPANDIGLPGKAVAVPNPSDSDILVKHFLGDYRKGLDLQHSGNEYLLTDSSVGDQVYLHKATGIRTWARAFDFSSENASPDDLQVLFHYVVEDDFYSLAGQFKRNMLSILENRQALFGRGVYCSPLEPDAFGSQEAVSCHVSAYCLDDYETNDFCIPIIAHRRDCLDLRRCQLPEMLYGCGKTIHGKDIPDGVDVWVVRIPNTGEAEELNALRTVGRNGENRLRLEVAERLARFDENHPFVKQSKNRLVACLTIQGKTSEAERVAAGRAADVSRSLQPQNDPAKTDRSGAAKAPVVTKERPRTKDTEVSAAGHTVVAKEPTRTPEVKKVMSAPEESAIEPVSEAVLAARFDLQNTVSQSYGGGAFCITSDVGMTLDDLKSESSSADDVQGQFEVEGRGGGIGELDKQLQWGEVNRRGQD